MSSIHYTVPTSSPESAVTQPGNGQDESFIPHFQKQIHHKGRMKEQRSQNKVVFVFFYFLFLKWKKEWFLIGNFKPTLHVHKKPQG